MTVVDTFVLVSFVLKEPEEKGSAKYMVNIVFLITLLRVFVKW